MTYIKTFALLSALLAVGEAGLADKYDVPWSINPGCSQVGVEPDGLSADLPAGYDYSCYESGPYVKRWSSTGGLNASNFLGADADMVGSLVDYLTNIMSFVVPILAFGIISVISCCCWSCGMMKCCAGGNNKSRKCCGFCCANPPKFTEGACEWVLMFFTVLLGVIVLGLSFQGLVINGVQNEAVDSMADAVGLIDGWMNTTIGQIEATTTDFEGVENNVAALKTVFANMKTQDIKAAATEAATELDASMSDAREQVLTVNDTIGTLTGSIGEMSGIFVTIKDLNAYRNTGLLGVWVTLAVLMMWELLVAFLRQWKPECTQKINCIFGFVTFIYLFVLSILFIVLTVLAVLTVVFGDICTSPDASIAGIIGGGALGGGDGDATTTAAVATTGAGGGIAMPEIGPSLMTYFIDCDTNNDTANSFNEISLSIFGMMDVGTAKITEMQDVFNDKEPEMKKAYDEAKKAHDEETMSDEDWETAETSWTDFQADKTASFAAIATVENGVEVLMTTLKGNATDEDAASDGSRGRRAVSNATPEKQGMTKGLFSVVQCYQVNARYQAVVNMLCTEFFDTIAMTVEYLLVAGIFMVVVEFCKRWMRPYNLAYEKGNQVTPVGEDKWDIAKGRTPKKGSAADGSLRDDGYGV